MPKSRRSKVVSLTKVKPGTREDKESLIQKIESCIDEYPYIYLFRVENMRNQYLQKVREDWKESKLFLGKTKVMALALGLESSTAKLPNLENFAKRLKGECGLLFTNSSNEEVAEYFNSFRHADYARPGCIVDQTITLPAGILYRGPDTFPHNMEPLLRSLGLNSYLERGKVCIPSEHTICKAGDKLTVQQADLLKHFFHQLAEFKINLVCYFHDGKIVELDENGRASN